jgi:hypothetical protein
MKATASMDRREFLGATGVLSGVLAAGQSAGAAGTQAESGHWTCWFSGAKKAERCWLQARTIAPHDKLDDAPYALVVKALDASAARKMPRRWLYCEPGHLRAGHRLRAPPPRTRASPR